MDRLLNPDTGLVVWTVITFLCLVFLLKKFAWGPLISAIEEREAKMRADREGTEAARRQAEQIRAQLEGEIAGLEAKSRELLAHAAKEGEALRNRLKSDAEAEARKIKEKTLEELAEEKERLIRLLRAEVADLSVMAAERLMRKSIDARVQKTVLDSFFKDLERQGKAN